MKINKKFSTVFFVFLGCLFPIIPIALLFSFFYLPKEDSPNVIPLTGTWQAQYEGITKPVTLPGLFYSSDGKGLIPDYKGKTWDVILHREVVLKEAMRDKDLFLMVCGTIFQTGRVMINGEFIGNIGVYQHHRKYGTAQGIDGFFIERKLLKMTNELTLYFESDDLVSFGLNDQRLFLGIEDTLRPYYEKNFFLNNFFNFGVVFFSLFMLVILTIMTVTEWKSPDRSKYLITGLFVLSSLLFNLFYSGSFVNYFVPIVWLDTLITASISLITLGNLEFVYSVFVKKPGWFDRLVVWLNRVLCVASIILVIAFVNNNQLFNVVANNFYFVVFFTFIYDLFLIIRSIIKDKNSYGLVMGFANLIFILSASNDVLSNLGLINTPLISNVGISIITIIGTIIVIADFVKISNTLKEKVEERTKELKEARDALWGEMELAKKIQTVLLPEKPAIPGYEISASMLTASEVGGDYYDFINVKNLNWAVIGDVSGHGVPAGLVMMMVQTAIHTVLEENPAMLPSNLLTVINRVIASNIKQLGEDKYMTITVFAVGEDGKFKFSGMHQPLVIYRHGKKAIERIDTKGMWIGIMDDITGMVQDDEVKLEKSDVLLLYTDGVTEAWEKGAVKGERGESNMFGDKNLDKALFNSAERPPEEIRNGVLKALEGYDFADDVTLVVMKRND